MSEWSDASEMVRSVFTVTLLHKKEEKWDADDLRVCLLADFGFPREIEEHPEKLRVVLTSVAPIDCAVDD